jgi:hypothetical protein
MRDPAFKRSRLVWLEVPVGGSDLAGTAYLELVPGVVQLRLEDAMFEAMLARVASSADRRRAAGEHHRAA